jgi:hypothetical protein
MQSNFTNSPSDALSINSTSNSSVGVSSSQATYDALYERFVGSCDELHFPPLFSTLPQASSTR